jgi:nucleoid-associated protein YgaU
VKGMGSVERVLVLGIVVVIVAILGIAVWGASDKDPGAASTPASDGGVVVQAPDTPPDGLPATITPPSDAPAAAPMSDLDRLKQLRDGAHSQAVADGAPAQGPGGSSSLPDGGSGAAPGALPVTPGKSGIKLDAVAPVNAVPAPGAAPAVKSLDGSTTKDATGAMTYTVASGDSLWKIAHKQYGDGDVQKHMDAILAANPSITAKSQLKIGQKLTLPAATAPDPTRLSADKQATATGGRVYEVKAGDTLSTIAQKELGSTKRWSEIFNLNKARLPDPAKIVVGMKLTLPPKS